MVAVGREIEFGPGFEPNEPLVIGIDQSWTGFGLTLMSASDPMRYKTYVYKSKGDTDVERLADLRRWIHSKLWDSMRNVVGATMEGYAFASQRAHMAGELGGLVKLYLYDNQVSYTVVAPLQLKKYVTGKGTGVSKSQMLLSTFKNFGVEFTDDNAADSYGLARIAGNFFTGETQRSVLEKLGLTQAA